MNAGELQSLMGSSRPRTKIAIALPDDEGYLLLDEVGVIEAQIGPNVEQVICLVPKREFLEVLDEDVEDPDI